MNSNNSITRDSNTSSRHSIGSGYDDDDDDFAHNLDGKYIYEISEEELESQEDEDEEGVACLSNTSDCPQDRTNTEHHHQHHPSQIFKTDTICCICLSKKGKMYKLPCGHSPACLLCMPEFCRRQFSDACSLYKPNYDIKCPLCWVHIGANNLTIFLGQEIFSKRAYIQQLVTADSHCVYTCPNDYCENGFTCTPRRDLAKKKAGTTTTTTTPLSRVQPLFCSTVYDRSNVLCPGCETIICRACSQKSHEGTSQHCTASTGSSSSSNIVDIIAHKLRSTPSKHLCPNCEVQLEKRVGNKITCSNCHFYFCWKCKKAINSYMASRCKCLTPISNPAAETLAVGGIIVGAVIFSPIILMGALIYSPFYVNKKLKKSSK